MLKSKAAGVAFLVATVCTGSHADEFKNRATCVDQKTESETGAKTSVTFLEDSWDQDNSASALVLLKEGTQTVIEKATMHFDKDKFTYTIDADLKSPLRKYLATDNTLALTGNLQGVNSDKLSGTKDKFKCVF